MKRNKLLLYEENTIAATTAFASVDHAARERDLQRNVADVPGGFSAKLISGKKFWYHQIRAPNGKLLQSYVGPDDNATREVIANHKNSVSLLALEQLLRLCRSAITLGCPSIQPAHARIITSLANHGLFAAGGILVGTHAFLAYQNMFGITWKKGNSTVAIDFESAGNNLSIALPGDIRIDAQTAMEAVQMGFAPNLAKTIFIIPTQPAFDISFVTARVASGDKPVFVENFNQPLRPFRFMELLLEAPLKTTLLANRGPTVLKVPDPCRYALHKLLLHIERAKISGVKSRNDLIQAAALLSYLLEHDLESLRVACKSILARGPSWRKHLNAGLKSLDRTFPELSASSALNIKLQ